jgi:hypothetical protein
MDGIVQALQGLGPEEITVVVIIAFISFILGVVFG